MQVLVQKWPQKRQILWVDILPDLPIPQSQVSFAPYDTCKIYSVKSCWLFDTLVVIHYWSGADVGLGMVKPTMIQRFDFQTTNYFHISAWVSRSAAPPPLSGMHDACVTCYLLLMYSTVLLNALTLYTVQWKTFTNFTVLWLFTKLSPRNLKARGLWHGKSEQSTKVFSTKIVFFTNLWSFLPRRFPAMRHMYAKLAW